MKWGIFLLLVLGVVAAACAAVLVGTVKLPFGTRSNVPDMKEVVIASRDLPPMTTLTADCLEKKKVPGTELPAGKLVSETESIGRILAVSVVKDQVLTESCFVWEGSGAQLAAKLEEGMRAFTVHLRTVPDRVLLYPGCIVDVLFSAKLSSRDRRGQALSATILSGIQVLTVAGDSVVSSPTPGQAEPGESNRNSAGRGLAVTLLVTPKQAEALQLAAENGTISLTIRNPLDKNLGAMDATVLSEGQLADLGSAFTPEILATARKDGGQNGNLSMPVNPGDPNDQARVVAPLAPAPAISPEQTTQIQPRSRTQPPWKVTVIRGSKTQEKELEASKSKVDKGDTD